MKVKINDKIYDSNETPIMLILTDEEKEHIANMDMDDTKYCSFPQGMSPTKIGKWMVGASEFRFFASEPE